MNLHKTFSGPHGGGGPGSGPIGVKQHLIKHLPKDPLRPTNFTDGKLGALSGTSVGSPAVLTIAWAYMRMLGATGLKKSTETAILNANYMRERLENHFDVLFTGSSGFNAHEFIIDIRPFKKYGIEAIDVAKRLQDFGLHCGTMSWPVPNTLMFEPTESESKETLDNYCDALIQIRHEIQKIIDGEYDVANNPLKNAPHPLFHVAADEWAHTYSRQEAAFPLKFVEARKHWPTVGRVNDLHGDSNLVCSCPPMESYVEA